MDTLFLTGVFVFTILGIAFFALHIYLLIWGPDDYGSRDK